MLPKTPKGELARDAILAAAEELFRQQGYNGTSMRDIARVGGYRSAAGLYNHFSDKEAIFVGLLNARHPYDEILDTIERVEGQHAEALLPAVFLALTELMTRHLGFFQLVLIDFLEFDGQHIRDLLSSLQERVFQTVTRITTLDDLRDDLPPFVVVRMMAMQVFGYVMTHALLPEPILDVMPEEAWKNKIVDVLLNGMQKKGR